MEITIFNMKFRLEILVLIGLALLILNGHLLCSCSRINFMEMFSNQAQNKMNKNIFDYTTMKGQAGGIPSRESFISTINDGQSSPYSQTSDKPISTKNWFNTASVNIYNDRNKNFNPKETSNLPDGEMLLLDKTPFKPECCPNVYSNSSGCACMAPETNTYLKNRGGNNVPYSEY